MKPTLERIDTSYWKNKDPEWKAAREADWPRIENMLARFKTKKKNMNPIRDYYLRGKLPKWSNYKDWDDSLRHLDIFMFLWLHPSWDKDVLTELRDTYLGSDQIVLMDIQKGFSLFLMSQGTLTAGAFKHIKQVDNPRYNFPRLEGYGELLFDVLMGDNWDDEYEIRGYTSTLGTKQVYHLPKDDIGAITTMGKWLRLQSLLSVNEDFLYQYDRPLEWWYQSAKDVDYFNLSQGKRDTKWGFERALWVIHNFDTEKEGDTMRTRLVHKLRKMLDEREFFDEFKDIWRRVKAGEVEPDDRWDI